MPHRHQLRRLQRCQVQHHLHHHFRNPKANHGVTSPVWDHVFRTADPVEVVRVPRKLAPFWLTDDSYAGFELRGRAPAA